MGIQLPPEEVERTRKMLARDDLTRQEMARELGIEPGTLRRRIKHYFPDLILPAGGYNQNGGHRKPKAPPPEQPGPKLPDFADDDISAEEMIDNLSRRVEKKLERHKQETWFPVEMPTDEPFGLCVFGDPHLGTHTNWPLLREHVDLCAKTNGLYGVNIGDTKDNWPVSGRLARLWADNDMSLSTEWKLTRWFFHDSGVDWLVWLLGNHDMFNTNSAAMFKEISRNVVPVMDTEAKFVLKTPNGSAFPVWARHDFKGHSQFNTLHAVMRNLRERADVPKSCNVLGIEGHKHQWAIHEEENADRGYCFTVARARGYKMADEHAMHLGFSSQEFGASLVWVCDPQAKNLAQATTIWKDVEAGAEYLTWLRKKHK